MFKFLQKKELFFTLLDILNAYFNCHYDINNKIEIK
jgi:hypothetical protein